MHHVLEQTVPAAAFIFFAIHSVGDFVRGVHHCYGAGCSIYHFCCKAHKHIREHAPRVRIIIERATPPDI